MEIVFSIHFKERNRLRSIDESIAMTIFNKADGFYEDTQTNTSIAVKRIEFQGKTRDVSLTYVTRGDKTVFVTIHPLKDGQKQNRINNGRWKPI